LNAGLLPRLSSSPVGNGQLIQEVSIKQFLLAMRRAGHGNAALYKWLKDYSGPGVHNRKTLDEDRLGFQYRHNHELSHLEYICQLVGIDASEVEIAARDARGFTPTSRQGRIFRGHIPWDKVAPRAQAFIDLNSHD
jgi:hypothetical protein